MAEHWRLNPEVSWVRLPVTAGFWAFFCSLFLFVVVVVVLYTERKPKNKKRGGGGGGGGQGTRLQ